MAKKAKRTAKRWIGFAAGFGRGYGWGLYLLMTPAAEMAKNRNENTQVNIERTAEREAKLGKLTGHDYPDVLERVQERFLQRMISGSEHRWGHSG